MDDLWTLMHALRSNPIMGKACEDALAAAAEALARSAHIAPAREPEPIDMQSIILMAAQAVTYYRALQGYGFTKELALPLTQAYVQALVVHAKPVRIELPPEPPEPTPPWA
jgi:hypothetical protein